MQRHLFRTDEYFYSYIGNYKRSEESPTLDSPFILNNSSYELQRQ